MGWYLAWASGLGAGIGLGLASEALHHHGPAPLDRIMGLQDTRHLRALAPIGSKANPLRSLGSPGELQIDGDIVTKPDGTRVRVDAYTDLEQLVRGPRANHGQRSSDHMQGTGSGWCRFV